MLLFCNAFADNSVIPKSEAQILKSHDEKSKTLDGSGILQGHLFLISMTFWLSSLVANVGITLLLVCIAFALLPLRYRIISAFSWFVAFATGTILATVFFEFLPEASAKLSGEEFAIFLLSGVLVFALVETLVHYHHCHDLSHVRGDGDHPRDDSIAHAHSHHGTLMNMGTFLHNGFHGIVLYTGFAAGFETGILLSVVILLHALPQNFANYVMNRGSFLSYSVAASGGIF